MRVQRLVQSWWAWIALILAPWPWGASAASAQEQVKPYFLLILDSSGSMAWDNSDRNNTVPDPSPPNSCGWPSSPMNDAKCAVTRVVNATGEAIFGLMSFDQPCNRNCCQRGAADDEGVWLCGDIGTCDDSIDAARMRVPVQDDNQAELLAWVDNVCDACGGAGGIREIWARGATPLSGALRRARWYFEGNGSGRWASPFATDPAAACRPAAVILLTDGRETCGGNPARRARDLRAISVPVPGGGTITKDVRTYVIGFGVTPGDGQLEDIATEGGTDAPGPHRAFYATDEESLALALSQIVADSLLVEVCNGLDDDCDGLTDEGFTKYCDRPAGHATADLCTDPGERVCDGVDDNCDGRTDEGLRNACGTCGPAPAEVCNGLDDDCDGATDEGGVCAGCRPEPEICDGVDNDCDGATDEGLTMPCGTDVGECTRGVRTCADGSWGACSGRGPSPETCNGLDDDCDGVTDRITRPCGSDVGECRAGTELCVDGSWGSCIGAVGPSAEVCDGLDNDCDGLTDEDFPESGGACGSDVGECRRGSWRCVAGALVCEGAVGPSAEECNGLDDDCDGLTDEDLGVGEPCGSDVGECSAGVYVCRDGRVECEGAVGPSAEECNGLDDDCDGTVDEPEDIAGLGEPCGSEEGVCRPGVLRCIRGEPVCEGSVPPAPEACDCEDNDCDGLTDEPPDSGSLCPEGARCIDCGCALPCEDSLEFGPRCPTGRTPVTRPDGTCWCVQDRCDEAACAAERIERDGEVLCAPDDPSVAACVCKENACTFACEGVVCPDGLVCDPRDPEGRCVEATCRGLGCPPGELCDRERGECVPHPCRDVRCAEGEACRDGACVPSCATVSCGAGERCRAGRCEPDPCASASCGAGEVCDPESGTCAPDRCAAVDCPRGTVCRPPAGECVEDPCERTVCPEGQVCRDGDCFAPEPPGSGGRRDGGADGQARRVLATGGGGCACAVGGTGEAPLGALPALLLGLLGLLGRRRRDGRRPRPPQEGRRARGLAPEALLAAAIGLHGGCSVDPFCLECPEPPLLDGGGEAGLREGGGGDAAWFDAGGEGGASADGGRCEPSGEPDDDCDGVDDDCDGLTDEEADTLGDPRHCGACGRACEPANALGECVDGACRVGRCDVGFHDLDGDPANGCEYRCLPRAEDDAVCNRADDDCDGATDEDVDLLGDPLNCGACGRRCRFPHVSGARCEGGSCTFTAPEDCEKDAMGRTLFWDLDGVADNGCEYACLQADPPVETCNGRDDDCDGMVDEGNPGGGAACGSDVGACSAGVERCVDGVVRCVGAVGPSVETCNGVDDDCDGLTDEDFDLATDRDNCGACGRRCVTPRALGACVSGACVVLACDAGWVDLDGDPSNGCEYACTYRGEEVCNGADDDCDGMTDEGLTPPTAYCNPNGVCAGTTPRCAGAMGWQCDYPATYEAEETRCDDLDNDCDGLTDEPFPEKGNPCGSGVGACRSEGTMRCNAAGDGLECSAPPPGSPSPERCNGVDDDCDGLTDETAATPGSHPSYVVDEVVVLPSGLRVYAYEASRPDATASDPGSLATRACSRPGVLPWTNLTRAEAEAACGAAGMRLCTEAEWQQACEAGRSCGWSYASGCDTFASDTCNGNEYDPVPGPPDDDRLLPTGAMASCYADWGARGRIHDMSGNAREWTAPRRAGVNPIRGGSYQSPAGGTRCDFDFSLADDAFRFPNVGFRCCAGP